VGVIGTNATIGSNAYARIIHRIDPQVKVFSLACPLFVPLAEEGYIDKEATYLIARDYLQTMHDVEIDTLVLGCTHYPLLKHVIGDVMGDKVTLIDSGEETAKVALQRLTESGLLKTGAGAPHLGVGSDDSGKKGAPPFGVGSDESGKKGTPPLGVGSDESGKKGAPPFGVGSDESGKTGTPPLGVGSDEGGKTGAPPLGVGSDESGKTPQQAVGHLEGLKGEHKFFVSDVPEKFSQVATRFLGEVVDKITRVDISGY
jgi:hypothetical protein